MKYLSRLLGFAKRAAVILLLVAGSLQQAIVPVQAVADEPCSGWGYAMSGHPSEIAGSSGPYKITITADRSRLLPGIYKVQGQSLGTPNVGKEYNFNFNASGTVEVTLDGNWYSNPWPPGNTKATGFPVSLILKVPQASGPHVECILGGYTVTPESKSFIVDWEVTQKGDDGCYDKTANIDVKVTSVKDANGKNYVGDLRLIINSNFLDIGRVDPAFNSTELPFSYSISPSQIARQAGGRNLRLRVVEKGSGGIPFAEGEKSISISPMCTDEDRERDPATLTGEAFEICNQIPDDGKNNTQRNNCTDCFEKESGIWTAVGCIPGSPSGIATTFFRVGMGIAGGLALLMILAAAFMFSTSQGEPKRTSEAKEIMQAAVIGLLFLIFSITILQFIGVTILHIPGFGE